MPADRIRLKRPKGRAALALFMLAAGLSPAPELWAAEAGQGARIIVTLRDGAAVSGELVSVEKDALVIDEGSGEAGRPIRLDTIAIIRVVRNPRWIWGGVLGLLAGLTPYVWLELNGESLEYPEAGIISGGAAGATLGALVLGTGMGADRIADVRTLSAAEAKRLLQALEGYARLRRTGRNPEASPAPLESSAGAGAPAPLTRPRVHITWQPGIVAPANPEGFDVDPAALRLRFVPTGDSTARSTRARLSLHRREKQSYRLFGSAREQATAMDVRLDYSPGPNLNLGLEYLDWGQWSVEFLSVWKGLEGYPDEEVGFQSLDILETRCLMASLAWKTNPVFLTGVSTLSLGGGAGLSWTTVRDEEPGRFFSFRRWDVDTWPAHGERVARTGVAFQAFGSYDYFFSRLVSLGTGAGYYFVRASYPERRASAAYALTVPDPAAAGGVRLLRGTVAFSTPDRGFNLSDFRFSVRLGIHF